MKRESLDGNIWVTTTSRLLNYHLAWNQLIWAERQEAGVTSIFIDRIDDPVFGPVEPTPQRLQGLTFQVPRSDKTRVYLGKREIGQLQRNQADGTGAQSVTVPLTSLTSPL